MEDAKIGKQKDYFLEVLKTKKIL